MPNDYKVTILNADGTAVDATNPLPVELSTSPIIDIGNVGIVGTDTTTQAQVKAASTAAVATDTALVVAISPNNGVTITPVSSSTMTVSQVTVPATANGISVLASNASRKGAVVTNPGPSTVFIAQTNAVTAAASFPLYAGSSFSIDEPLYTGAIFGIVASGTQVVGVLELT